MANVKWSAFAAGTTIAGTDIVVGLQGGTNVQWTWSAVATYIAGTVGLTVGTTAIAGGSTTRVLFDNAGVLGEYAISGTGSVAMTNSPIFVTPALGTPASGVATNLTGLPLTTGVTGVLPVANGGTNASSAGITAFNNITGYSAAGATGTTSTNLVFSTSPTLVTPVLGAATGTSLSVTGALTAFSGTAIPAGGTTGSGVKFSSTSNFGVFFGSGAPTLSAAQGSIYLRSDGTSTTGIYTNTDGATTWAAAGGGGSPGGSTTQVQYNSSGSFAGAAGFTFDGTSVVTLGVAGSSVGGVAFKNATSGTITLQAVTGALGTVTLSLPATTTTLAGLGIAQSFTQLQTFSLGASIASGQSLNWNSDTYLNRDAANTLGLRNSTNAQQFNIYTTYTDASNYERLRFDSAAGNSRIYTEAAGTGSNRNLSLFAGGSLLGLGAASGVSLYVTTTSLAPASDSFIYTLGGSNDVSFRRAAAGIAQLRGSTSTTPAAWEFYTYGASPPSAPGASLARLYTDTSGGKIRLMVIFPSGAAQQIAIEP